MGVAFVAGHHRVGRSAWHTRRGLWQSRRQRPAARWNAEAPAGAQPPPHSGLRTEVQRSVLRVPRSSPASLPLVPARSPHAFRGGQFGITIGFVMSGQTASSRRKATSTPSRIPGSSSQDIRMLWRLARHATLQRPETHCISSPRVIKRCCYSLVTPQWSRVLL